METLRLIILSLIFSFFISFSVAQITDTISAIPYLIQKDSSINQGQQDIAMANTYIRQAELYSLESQLENAIELYKKADEIFRTNHLWEKSLQATLALQDCYRTLGLFSEALEVCEEAINLGNKQVGENNEVLQRLILQNAFIHSQLGESWKAIEIYEERLPKLINQFGEDAEIVSVVYDHLGSIYTYNLGETDKALEYFLKSLSIMEKLYSSDHPKMADINTQIGVSYFISRQLPEAQYHYEKSYEIYKKIYSTEENESFLKCYGNLANCYVLQGHHDKAEVFYKKFIKLAQNLYGKDHLRVVQGQYNLAFFYYTIENYEAAITIIDSVLLQQKKLEVHPIELANTYNFSAALNMILGNYKNALEVIQQALHTISEGFDASNIYHTPNIEQIRYPHQAVTFLHMKLNCLYEWHQKTSVNLELIESAITTGDLSLQLWQKLREQFGDQEMSKAQVSELIQEIIHLAALLANKGQKETNRFTHAEKAFQFLEESKALLLQESFINAEAKENAGLPIEVITKMNDIKEKITHYEGQILTATQDNDTLRINQLRNDSLFYANQEYEKFLETIEANYPSYYNLKYKFKTISLPELQNSLKPNQLHIEYLTNAFLEEDTIKGLIFIIEKEAPLKIREIKFPAEIVQKASKLKKICSSYQLGRSDRKKSFIHLSNDLFQALIAPIKEELENKNNITIVGESFTHYIPFELLLPTKEIKPFDELDFLIKKYEISYQYSGTLMVRSQQREKNFKHDLLAFAPVFDNNRQAALKRTATTLDTALRSIDQNGNFRPLLNSKAEVENIAKLFQNKKRNSQVHILLKEDANEENLKKALKQSYRFVHLASHSFSDLKTPELSGIACIPTENTEQENGILFSGEVYNMSINSDLLVLSSCESGVGQLLDGEGMLGLNRSFVYAGVPNVVFSLWKVFDHVTKDMMSQFYKYILDGHSYSAALRLVKLDMLKNEVTASPEFWGAFLLIGE